MPAVVLSVVLVVRLARSGRVFVAGATAAVMLVAGLLVYVANWPGAFARTFYAINNRVAALVSVSAGEKVGVFLPQWLGIPDGAIGFGYVEHPPAQGDMFDGFGDNVYACRSLGDGWYWLTRRGGEC